MSYYEQTTFTITCDSCYEGFADGDEVVELNSGKFEGNEWVNVPQEGRRHFHRKCFENMFSFVRSQLAYYVSWTPDQSPEPKKKSFIERLLGR